MVKAPGIWRTALYCRLSREDGDRPESDSISNQKKLLTEYVQAHPELIIAGFYLDDGYTGTNFDRPAFARLLSDIEGGVVDCVLVKDLSRFGRDYIDAGRYLERWFPAHNVRFIAVTDNIDSSRGAYDMMVPLKNLFNAQYARDISLKVQSALAAKQKRGEFIGAFACYGYRKDPENRNRLVVDPAAAQVVHRIFDLFEDGTGKLRIARILNAEGIPCPSEYKRLMGERYRNGGKLEGTTYWTYATIHRILKTETYIGNMEQGRSRRLQVHGAAVQKERSDWIVVPGTHEALISPQQWARVQSLLTRSTRMPDFSPAVSPFAGYLKCGECGRSLSRTVRGGRAFYICGSYKRYGAQACSPHHILEETLVNLVLGDLNRIIAEAGNLNALLRQADGGNTKKSTGAAERAELNGALNRVRRMKQSVYEDYRSSLLSREEYQRYRADYSGQERTLERRLTQLARRSDQSDVPEQSWAEQLALQGQLNTFDRITVAELLKKISVHQDGTIEVIYRLAPGLSALLDGTG